MMLLSALIGANYGANLSIFPSVTKDYYGLKNFGVNYGLVFTAWGIGGFALSLVAGTIFDSFEAFTYAYYVASAMLVLAAAASFFLKRRPQPKGLGARDWGLGTKNGKWPMNNGQGRRAAPGPWSLAIGN